MTSLQGLVRSLLLTITGGLAVTSPGYGAQPTDVVTSDANGNTAMGDQALLNLSTGLFNTASGAQVLFSNTSGEGNSAFGYFALRSNTSGGDNTAIGSGALFFNMTGGSNTAIGEDALEHNNGDGNTAVGQGVLAKNTTGISNTGLGAAALLHTLGNNNTASGYEALFENATGSNNTGIGASALGTNRGGSNNIALGMNAGYYVRGGNYNIEIGNVGTATDAGTIRIGTSNHQSATYVAGITTAHVAGSAVYITPAGQLGVQASSERYKTNVASMGSSSEKVRALRPVTFRLKSDPKAEVQYGLIAEEVAKVYPELVIRGDKGQIEGVRYEELTPMLLNEIQRQQAQLRDMQQQVAELQEFRRSMQGQATGK
jgi:hypothetical protein